MRAHVRTRFMSVLQHEKTWNRNKSSALATTLITDLLGLFHCPSLSTLDASFSTTSKHWIQRFQNPFSTHCTITLPSLIFIQGSQELYHIPFPPGQILPVDARQHGPSRRYRDCESIVVKGNLHPAQRHEVIGKNLVAQTTHQLLENGLCEIMNDAYCDCE